MDTFATVEQLEARWRTLTDSEKAIAQTTLEDVSAYITSELRRGRVRYSTDDEVFMRNAEWVTCSVAKRKLSPTLDGGGTFDAPVTKMEQQAGVFNAAYTFANPMGDTYLTAQEKKALGIGRLRIFSARAALVDMERGRDVSQPIPR